MLRSVKELKGYKIRAKDGDIGHVKEFYFDDQKWSIRYLIVDIGNWLPGKCVHISPAGFYGEPDRENHAFPVIFTKEMVKTSPDVDTDKPVSRQKEIELALHYNWAAYWEQEIAKLKSGGKEVKGGQHLRSTKEVAGYHIHAVGGEIGHVEDFIVDDDEWKIRYIVVDTRNWLPGRKVLIDPLWIKSINWEESMIDVDMKKSVIKKSPPYDPSVLINRCEEESLYDYYGRKNTGLRNKG